MKAMKFMLAGLLIGVLIGMLLGINIGKGRPLLSNPFADEPVTEKARDLYEGTKDLIKRQSR